MNPTLDAHPVRTRCRRAHPQATAGLVLAAALAHLVAWWVASGALPRALRLGWLLVAVVFVALSFVWFFMLSGIPCVPVFANSPAARRLNRGAIRYRALVNGVGGLLIVTGEMAFIRACATGDLATLATEGTVGLFLVYAGVAGLCYAKRLFLPQCEALIGRRSASLHLRGASLAAYSEIFSKEGFKTFELADSLRFLREVGLTRVTVASPNVGAVRVLGARLVRAGIAVSPMPAPAMSIWVSLIFRTVHPQVVRKQQALGLSLGGLRLYQEGFEILLPSREGPGWAAGAAQPTSAARSPAIGAKSCRARC